MSTISKARTSNPLEDHLGYQLRRASSLVMATLADRLADLGLTIVETSILILVDANSGIFQSEIGRTLGIKRANVAPLAAALERRGLVLRSTSGGRSIGLSTSAEGHELAIRAEAIMKDNDRSLFDRLDAPLRLAMLQALALLWRTDAAPVE